ncbi:MAG: hypothetical protein ACFFAH_16770, partial [Promethearchaeota archaeon]
DPYGEEHIYPRKVSNFPLEPKYAKPHPSSTNIGDLQDLLIKTENLTISSFLKENFVRISSKIAKQIIELAERDLQDKLNILVLKNGFIKILEKKSDDIHYLCFEKKIYGRSQKPRDKLIIYQLDTEDLKNKYWELISKYNQLNKKHEKIKRKIKKQNNLIDKAETQKEIKNLEKTIRDFLKEIEGIRKEKDNIKIDLDKIISSAKGDLHELKKFKNRTEYEDLVRDVQISKVKPAELTTDQFNSLFFAFKSIKYMAPPTDTAIPVGESVLENTLIKEIGLKVSENLDDFDTPLEIIKTTTEYLLEEKKNELKKEDPKTREELLNNIAVSEEEIVGINSMILTNVDVKDESLEFDQFKQSLDDLLSYPKDEPIDAYGDLFEYFIETFSRDDDFLAAETRDPTSGKGLAYVVEAVMAYSKLIEVPKRSRDVLSRFVNRTPKLRDSADCAITKAVQSVNWKNYKLDIYDNGLPKGPIKLLVNVSGPFVHLMFKSQSKNALADDEDLIKEIKFCLEAVGRKLRIYLNRRASIRKSEKRASLIEKYIPLFAKSLYNIASQGDSKYKDKVNDKELQKYMREAIGKKPTPEIEEKIETEEIKVETIKPPIVEKIKPEIELHEEVEVKKEEIEIKQFIKEEKPLKKKPFIMEAEVAIKKEEILTQDLNKLTLTQLREFAIENNVSIPSKARKNDIIKIIQETIGKKEIIRPRAGVVEPLPPRKPTPAKPIKIVKAKPIKRAVSPTTQVTPKIPTRQTQLPVITNTNILNVLTNEWQTIKHLIFKLKIKDMMDARFLQIKLKELERKGQVLVDIRMGKKHWRLK